MQFRPPVNPGGVGTQPIFRYHPGDLQGYGDIRDRHLREIGVQRVVVGGGGHCGLRVISSLLRTPGFGDYRDDSHARVRHELCNFIEGEVRAGVNHPYNVPGVALPYPSWALRVQAMKGVEFIDEPEWQAAHSLYGDAMQPFLVVGADNQGRFYIRHHPFADFRGTPFEASFEVTEPKVNASGTVEMVGGTGRFASYLTRELVSTAVLNGLRLVIHDNRNGMEHYELAAVVP